MEPYRTRVLTFEDRLKTVEKTLVEMQIHTDDEESRQRHIMS